MPRVTARYSWAKGEPGSGMPSSFGASIKPASSDCDRGQVGQVERTAAVKASARVAYPTLRRDEDPVDDIDRMRVVGRVRPSIGVFVRTGVGCEPNAFEDPVVRGVAGA